MSQTIVYAARKIITLDPTTKEATHVAVRDGRILAVGDADCATPWGAYTRDETLADTVLLPGFVEGHAHLLAGAMWDFAYVGFQDRYDPEGRLWRGLGDTGAVVQGLSEALASLPEGAPLIAWGFDPIFLEGERLNRRHLDVVSTDRPIVILHSNFHLMTVNSAGLALAGYDRSTNAEGVLRFDDGEPTGELQEMAAMFPIFRRLSLDIGGLARTERAIEAFGQIALRAGVTTSTDLLNDLADADLDRLLAVTGRAGFPVRLVAMLNGLSGRPQEIADRARSLKGRSSDRLRLGGVKLMTDGSIQGYTARLKWPGYINGQPNGIWNTPPERLFELVDVLHSAGVQAHIHTNGDEASEVALDAIEAAVANHAGRDIRHTLQHAQMAGPEQFRRMARLGVAANLFANHLWYFGDAHYESTVGPERAAAIDACRSALDAGVTLSIHSDAPVTPLGPLHVAWCAVNRLTPKGRVLGAAQRLTVQEALRAITLGAAETLHLDGEIGSITVGKRADFAVLAEDPFAVAPEALRDVPVLGTVLGGEVHLAGDRPL